MKKKLVNGLGIFIPVSDLERSTQWYKKMLDFELLHTDEPYANVMKMGDGIVVFCLVKSYEIKQPVFPKNNYGVDHYYNFHTGDVEGIHKSFVDKGANVSDIHSFDNMKGFSLYDPDGNRFGIVQ